MEDKLEPSITYLQKLGPEHIKQIFESSRWVFSMDKNLAFKHDGYCGKRGDEKTRKEAYAKLLNFVDTSNRFGFDRLYGLLSSTDLYEARAILLGRLGRHDQALEMYVYRLHDYLKAEQIKRCIPHIVPDISAANGRNVNRVIAARSRPHPSTQSPARPRRDVIVVTSSGYDPGR
ncbi:hypothetical protein K443DRAFT_9138 [Laccaria amethystina LaAM-08-1]|uniref:Uncharacterized protein n=1 Tax=Laccaria amethystina LaAM-08-1 TaxID=1095629 RepID=A0A0C9XR88_9AGAR|nr:hypothetical protein K443DRAFT_9138 [Laccaria amethystina LaAM-08-1]